MKRRDRLFLVFALIQALVAYLFGIVMLYPETLTFVVLKPSALFLCLLIISTIGIEYLIYSKK